MDLSTLVKMSNTYGSNPAYVLAGGGNTSVKDDTTLYVKGSGTQLATIKAEEFVKMDRARLNEIMKTEYPADDVKRESAYLADVMAAVTDDDKTKRPSVEALLHNLFAYTYVLHVHPTLVENVEQAKDVLDAFMKEHDKEPRLILVQGVGAFIMEDDKAKAAKAQLLVKDAIKLAVYAESFGGALQMTDDITYFITHWEAEAYRSKK